MTKEVGLHIGEESCKTIGAQTDNTLPQEAGPSSNLVCLLPEPKKGIALRKS
jgi:hypothetical protein